MEVLQPTPLRRTFSIFVLLFGALSAAAGANAPSDWRDVYDPLVLRSLNVKLTQADFDAIRTDDTFSIWANAEFWLDGDTDDRRYAITIRRKSATALG
jgi:hypothetical protein